jgi:hypothetical protein
LFRELTPVPGKTENCPNTFLSSHDYTAVSSFR